jgi:hypothetical protein
MECLDEADAYFKRGNYQQINDERPFAPKSIRNNTKDDLKCFQCMFM